MAPRWTATCEAQRKLERLYETKQITATTEVDDANRMSPLFLTFKRATFTMYLNKLKEMKDGGTQTKRARKANDGDNMVPFMTLHELGITPTHDLTCTENEQEMELGEENPDTINFDRIFATCWRLQMSFRRRQSESSCGYFDVRLAPGVCDINGLFCKDIKDKPTAVLFGEIQALKDAFKAEKISSRTMTRRRILLPCPVRHQSKDISLSMSQGPEEAIIVRLVAEDPERGDHAPGAEFVK
ncbi:Aste57867_16169 [Aphanomyces stellatus]|uniref:Aste57867_16169 protein n=1 Tax=Aphanomyces stellatus TaxID=120398 RepID=A0A485L5K7_9STRA|nr:hypothetical protein As57867_016113 [Aphanomyces stellatus]VFT92947.1 Aste57867_16169 [Aphanomyces stellatus]